MRETLRTVCLRDCPDGCGLCVDVEGGAVLSLRGDPDHPVTRGFVCRRTKRDYPRFLSRSDRIVRPRQRTAEGWRDLGWDEALSLCGERLRATIAEHGPEAVLFIQSAGSMGLLAEACGALFDEIGATQLSGGICMDAGEWAQQADFGELRVSDWDDLGAARALVLWGKNPQTASPHLLARARELRARGVPVVLIDPLPTRSRSVATRFVQPRPGRDAYLALAVSRRLFEQGCVSPEAATFCDGLEAFRALAFERSVAEAAALCDVEQGEIEELAMLYGHARPTTTWIGGGLQRWCGGAETVRAIDALCTVAGHVGVPGGGAFFETPRRRGLGLPAPRPDRPRPRTIRSALLGHDLLHAERPPIRFGWIQRCNPVTQFPDSLAVERGLRSLGFLVVVDAFLTDTAACADLVLPPALMLECDDLVGSYGHHHLGLARRVVDPPAGVRTDLEISQLLARELGRGPILEGTAAERIDRMLAPLGLRRADLEGGTVKRPGEPAVAFAGRRFATPSGRARLLGELAPPPPEGGHAGAARSHPLHLLTVASVEHQTSQVPPEDQQGLPEIVVHPEAPGVAGRVSGAEALVRSASVPSAALRVRLRLDAKMRRDTALLVRGGWVRFGRGVNVLVGARESYNGGCAAFYDELARIE